MYSTSPPYTRPSWARANEEGVHSALTNQDHLPVPAGTWVPYEEPPVAFPARLLKKSAAVSATFVLRDSFLYITIEVLNN